MTPTWTMVYDEGLELRFPNAKASLFSYFGWKPLSASSFFEKERKRPDDYYGEDEQGKTPGFLSDCARTMVGWGVVGKVPGSKTAGASAEKAVCWFGVRSGSAGGAGKATAGGGSLVRGVVRRAVGDAVAEVKEEAGRKTIVRLVMNKSGKPKKQIVALKNVVDEFSHLLALDLSNSTRNIFPGTETISAADQQRLLRQRSFGRDAGHDAPHDSSHVLHGGRPNVFARFPIPAGELFPHEQTPLAPARPFEDLATLADALNNKNVWSSSTKNRYPKDLATPTSFSWWPTDGGWKEHDEHTSNQAGVGAGVVDSDTGAPGGEQEDPDELSDSGRVSAPVFYNPDRDGLKTLLLKPAEQPLNQGSCGSCYAISAVFAIESRFRINLRKRFGVDFDLKLSPEAVVSCSGLNQACNGGYPFLVGRHAFLHGIPQQDCMAYVAESRRPIGFLSYEKCFAEKSTCPGGTGGRRRALSFLETNMQSDSGFLESAHMAGGARTLASAALEGRSAGLAAADAMLKSDDFLISDTHMHQSEGFAAANALLNQMVGGASGAASSRSRVLSRFPIPAESTDTDPLGNPVDLQHTPLSGVHYFVRDYGYVGDYYGGCSEEKMRREIFARGPIAVAAEV